MDSSPFQILLIPLLFLVVAISKRLSNLNMHRINEIDFISLVEKSLPSFVLVKPAGFLYRHNRYICNLHGLTLYTITKHKLNLPPACAQIESYYADK